MTSHRELVIEQKKTEAKAHKRRKRDKTAAEIAAQKSVAMECALCVWFVDTGGRAGGGAAVQACGRQGTRRGVQADTRIAQATANVVGQRVAVDNARAVLSPGKKIVFSRELHKKIVPSS